MKGVSNINFLIAPNPPLAPYPVQATCTVGSVFIKQKISIKYFTILQQVQMNDIYKLYIIYTFRPQATGMPWMPTWRHTGSTSKRSQGFSTVASSIMYGGQRMKVLTCYPRLDRNGKPSHLEYHWSIFASHQSSLHPSQNQYLSRVIRGSASSRWM